MISRNTKDEQKEETRRSYYTRWYYHTTRRETQLKDESKNGTVKISCRRDAERLMMYQSCIDKDKNLESGSGQLLKVVVHLKKINGATESDRSVTWPASKMRDRVRPATTRLKNGSSTMFWHAIYLRMSLMSSPVVLRSCIR